MPDFDHYSKILESVKKGALLLDLGCCFAQEVHQVVSNCHLIHTHSHGFVPTLTGYCYRFRMERLQKMYMQPTYPAT